MGKAGFRRASRSTIAIGIMLAFCIVSSSLMTVHGSRASRQLVKNDDDDDDGRRRMLQEKEADNEIKIDDKTNRRRNLLQFPFVPPDEDLEDLLSDWPRGRPSFGGPIHRGPSVGFPSRGFPSSGGFPRFPPDLFPEYSVAGCILSGRSLEECTRRN